MRLDVIRGAHLLLYESLACRLDPHIDVLKQFRKYRSAHDRRYAKKQLRRLEKQDDATRAQLFARGFEVVELGRRALFRARMALDSVSFDSIAMPRKAAYAALVVLYSVSAALGIWALSVTGLAVAATARSTPWTVAALGWQVGSHPAFLFCLLLIALFTVRRLLFRLADPDVD